jgi:inner membrane protein
VLILGFRDFEHRRAVTAMDSFMYHNAVPQRLAAYPYMVNPFHWHGVVETADFFETVPVDSLAPEVKSESQGRMFYKPEETDASRAAKASYLGRVYLDWAVFPYVQVEKFSGGYLANFQDLRYTFPDQRGRTPLEGYVVLSPELRVLDEGMATRNAPTVESLERAGRQSRF